MGLDNYMEVPFLSVPYYKHSSNSHPKSPSLISTARSQPVAIEANLCVDSRSMTSRPTLNDGLLG